MVFCNTRSSSNSWFLCEAKLEVPMQAAYWSFFLRRRTGRSCPPPTSIHQSRRTEPSFFSRALVLIVFQGVPQSRTGEKYWLAHLLSQILDCAPELHVFIYPVPFHSLFSPRCPCLATFLCCCCGCNQTQEGTQVQEPAPGPLRTGETAFSLSRV